MEGKVYSFVVYVHVCLFVWAGEETIRSVRLLLALTLITFL